MRNSDVRKFNDVFRQILAGNAAQRAALTAWLEERYARRELAYGLHVADRAHMTCLVFDFPAVICTSSMAPTAASSPRRGLQGEVGKARGMIAVDWGTSSLRAYRLRSRRPHPGSGASSHGILASLPASSRNAGGADRRLERNADRDERHGRQPAGLDRGALRAVPGRVRRNRRALSRGRESGKGVDRAGPLVPRRNRRAGRDARRGEQILGAAAWQGRADLPAGNPQQVGRGGERPDRSASRPFMTGEVYAVLSSTASSAA